MADKKDLSDPITLRLPKDLLAEIEAVAAATDRTRSWVMVRAMRLYMAGEGAEVLEIAEAVREMDDDEGTPMDDLLAELDEVIAGETKAA